MQEEKIEQGLWGKWKSFLYDIVTRKEWIIFVNIARVLTFIGVAIIAYELITEIEAVKILGTDACKYCMEKTGATCVSPIK